MKLILLLLLLALLSGCISVQPTPVVMENPYIKAMERDRERREEEYPRKMQIEYQQEQIQRMMAEQYEEKN